MKIRSNTPAPVDAPATASSEAVGKPFQQTLQNRISDTLHTNPLSSVAAQFSKSDLADPAKQDQIVKLGLRQVLDRDFHELPGGDRDRITDWMTHDPLLRQKILSHIGRLVV